MLKVKEMGWMDSFMYLKSVRNYCQENSASENANTFKLLRQDIQNEYVYTP
jgi:hypothetical protein